MAAETVLNDCRASRWHTPARARCQHAGHSLAKPCVVTGTCPRRFDPPQPIPSITNTCQPGKHADTVLQQRLTRATVHADNTRSPTTVHADITRLAGLCAVAHVSHLPHDLHAHYFLPHLDLDLSIFTLLVIANTTRGYQLVTLQHNTAEWWHTPAVDARLQWCATNSPVGTGLGVLLLGPTAGDNLASKQRKCCITPSTSSPLTQGLSWLRCPLEKSLQL